MTRHSMTIDGLSKSEALAHIALVINDAEDHTDGPQAEAALGLADALEERGLPAEVVPVLDYFRANAWSVLYAARRQTPDEVWAFDQPELQMQMWWLRKAINSEHGDKVDALQRCQMFTNLGNLFSTVGRMVEAQAMWTRALGVRADFWMARANRGNGRWHYARALADMGHAAVFMAHAHADLEQAAADAEQAPEYGEPGLRERFIDDASRVRAVCRVDEVWANYQSSGWPMGKSDEERSYRQWALDHALFLNPLNDLGPESIAASDVLTLPDFEAVPGEPPIIAGMFSELKQTFASARWLLWEGVTADTPHFSDEGVDIYNTLDYAVYGLGTEKLKLAFGMGYSLFDKIAYFLNFYLDLGINERAVDFKSIWEGKKQSRRAQEVSEQNLPLRGLFWLSKDLFDPDVRESPEPEARDIGMLRNHIEHKYVKVIEDWAPPPQPGSLFHDRLAHSLSRSGLELRAVRLLQLVRSALVYLTLAVHEHERKRPRDPSVSVGALPLTSAPFDTRR